MCKPSPVSVCLGMLTGQRPPTDDPLHRFRRHPLGRLSHGPDSGVYNGITPCVSSQRTIT